MLPSASGLLRRLALRSLEQIATVYARGADGTYSTALVSDLACSLQTASREPTASGPQRVDAADLRTLYFDPSYAMPEGAQVEVNVQPGIRWNVKTGTIEPSMAPGNVNVLNKAELVRARH